MSVSGQCAFRPSVLMIILCCGNRPHSESLRTARKLPLVSPLKGRSSPSQFRSFRAILDATIAQELVDCRMPRAALHDADAHHEPATGSEICGFNCQWYSPASRWAVLRLFAQQR